MVKRRESVVQVYVTQEEKALIEAAATRKGLSVAAFVRQLVLETVAEPPRVSKTAASQA